MFNAKTQRAQRKNGQNDLFSFASLSDLCVLCAKVFAVAALLVACSFKPAKIFASYTHIEVREVGRSLYCNAPGQEVTARLFSGAAAVLGWMDARSVRLSAKDLLADVPYAVIEMGQRNTGGYGVAVSRAAVLRGELLILSATFVSPDPDRMVTQALTSPCVLVQLPPGRYSTVEVQDQTGTSRATGRLAP